jgi:hypothetical protein
VAVAFKELAGSPIEWYGPEGVQAERHLLCAWADRRALVREVLGDGYEFGGQSRATYPGTANIVAMRAHVEAFGDDVVQQSLTQLTEGLNAYQGFAKVTINYELLVSTDREDFPRVANGTFLTYRMLRGWETVELPGDDLQWEGQPSAAVPSAAVGAIRLPVTDHHLTWHRVVRPPWTAIRTVTGTVNRAAFLGAAAETLLFDGATAQREFLRISDADEAEFAWSIDFVFRERAARLLIPGAAAGWNHQYRSQPTDSAGWDRLHTAAISSHYVYRSTDFSALLEYEASQ